MADTTLSCPACGTALQPDSRFCRHCGRPVVAADAPDPAPAAPPNGADPPSGPPASLRGKHAQRRPAYPTVFGRGRATIWRIIAGAAVVVVIVAAVTAVALARRGGPADQQVTLPAAASPSPTPPLPTPTIAASATTTPMVTVTIPAAAGTATAVIGRGPAASPTPRNVNGLMVVDETWTGRVVEAGGLRIRSAPRVDPANVVGSVAAGTEVMVEGRVLNGQEAEPGKGTEWLIVGPGRYIYAGTGYVERVP